MSNYRIVNGELYHWGVKGMKWGVRRTPEQLGRRIVKLHNKNIKLVGDVDKYTKKSKEYDDKSTRLKTRNSKFESRLAKASGKKAKYDLKLKKQLAKRNPNEDKVAKFVSKSAKYELQMLKSQKKLKYNKYAIKSEEFQSYANKAQEKIEKNANLMRIYSNTISGISEGKVKQGRLFMQYITN